MVYVHNSTLQWSTNLNNIQNAIFMKSQTERNINFNDMLIYFNKLYIYTIMYIYIFLL